MQLTTLASADRQVEAHSFTCSPHHQHANVSDVTGSTSAFRNHEAVTSHVVLFDEAACVLLKIDNTANYIM